MSAEPQPTAGAASGAARSDAQRESSAFQRALLECADYAIISTTPDGVIRTFNRAAERMLGYLAEEVVGKVTPEIIHDYDEVVRHAAKLTEELGRPVAAGFEAFVAKTHQGLADEQEWTYIRKDGSRLPVQLSVTAMRDEAGQIIGFLGIAHDITRRREAQARVGQLAAQLDRRVRQRTRELQASQQRFGLVSAIAPVGVYHTSADGQCDYLNQRWCELTGMTAPEGLGNGWEQALHPEDRDAVHEEWNRAVREQRMFSMEYRYLRPDGDVRWVFGQTVAELDSAGKAIGYFGTVTDITERKRAEQELRTSEERLKLAQQAARVGTFELNLRSGVNLWSPELEAMYGLPPGGFPGTQPAWENLVHPDDLAQAKALVQRAFDTNESVEGEWRAVWPDGSTHWLVGRFQVLRDAAGKPLRLTGVNLDITDRKRNEQALRQARDELETRVQERTAELARLNMLLHSEVEDRKAIEEELRNREEQLRDLFENATDLIQSVTPDGRILFVNRAWLNTLGYRMSELAALTIFDIIHPDCLGECQEHFARVMRGEALNNFQAIFRTKDGRKIHVEGNASARFENGRPVATRGIFRDISKRRAVEEEREKLIAELQAALAEVKTLSGLLPVCGWCKKIRDDSGYWNSVEGYLKKSSGVDITHGICPDCQVKMMAELDKLTAESGTPPPPSS